jgi:hypothetical protein
VAQAQQQQMVMQQLGVTAAVTLEAMHPTVGQHTACAAAGTAGLR